MLPRRLSANESTCWCKRPRCYPWLGKIPWRRAWLPTPVFLPGESHGQRSLAGYSPQGRKELDITGQLSTQNVNLKILLGSSVYTKHLPRVTRASVRKSVRKTRVRFCWDSVDSPLILCSDLFLSSSCYLNSFYIKKNLAAVLASKISFTSSLTFCQVHQTTSPKWWLFKYQAMSVCMWAKSLQSRLTLCHPMDYSLLGSSVFSRQEYWSGLPCSSQGYRPNSGIELQSLVSPALAGVFFTTSAPGEAKCQANPASNASSALSSLCHHSCLKFL